MSAFQTARYYELLGNRGGRLEREGPFLLEALARAPGRRVADIACGLGLHAHWLAEQVPDATVRAFDASEAMVGHAQATRPHPRVVYAHGDMRDIVGGPYDLLLCLGNSLALLDDVDALRRFFDGAHHAAAPGALVVTQSLHFDADAMQRPRIRVERATLPEGELVAVKRFQPQRDRTLLAITYHAATEEALTDIAETVTLRHWSDDTLVEEARRAGFAVEGVYGDYQRAPLLPDASDIVLCLQKPR